MKATRADDSSSRQSQTLAHAHQAEEQPQVALAAAAGVDPERLAKISARMQAFVDQGTIAGAVMLLARHGVVVMLEAVGYQDLESKTPMRTDTIFQTRSMMKSVTAVGIMILLEEGLLTLSDPVEKHLPEFRGQLMIETRDGDQVLTTKKPSRLIAIRDLLTHTSGMLGEPYREPFKSWIQEFWKKRDKTVAEVVPIFAQQPLEFEPGTKFLYSDPGFSVAGRIIEVASGQAYRDFVEQRILRPLGMKDSFYIVPPEKYHRIASVYVLEDGKLKKSSSPDRTGWKYVGGAGGWFSTASDIFAFYQMVLSGGSDNGVRILSRASVELMTAVHTGDLEAAGWIFPQPGVGYGLGWRVVREPVGTLGLQSIGSYGHGGYLGTYGWVDPKKDLVGVFLIQRMLEGRSGHGPEEKAFVAMAVAAIAD